MSDSQGHPGLGGPTDPATRTDPPTQAPDAPEEPGGGEGATSTPSDRPTGGAPTPPEDGGWRLHVPKPGSEEPADPALSPETEREAWDRPAACRVIALANQKGGVGKTTTVINLGAALAEVGMRVLLVDMDPQGSLGLGLGLEPHGLQTTTYDLLMDPTIPPADAVVRTDVADIALLPSNIDLAGAELSLVQEVAREHSLKRVLDQLRPDYDYILIDCPPSLGLLTVNGLTAADGVIVPLECEYFALRGMGLLMQTIEKVRLRLNPQLEVKGIVATMTDTRTIHAREVLERVHEAFGELVFKTNISRTIRFAEAPVAGEPILTYAPESKGTAAYRDLARELLHRTQ